MQMNDNKALYGLLAQIASDISSECGHPIPAGYRLVRCDGLVTRSVPGFVIALLDDKAEEVVYYCYSIIIEEICTKNKPAAQSVSWRSAQSHNTDVVHDLHQNVIKNYILQRHVAIVSDGNQYSGGKFFWERQISAALNDNKYVYLYKVQRPGLELIADERGFQVMKDKIWSDQPADATNLVLISNEELSINAEYQLPGRAVIEMQLMDYVDLSKPFQLLSSAA